MTRCTRCGEKIKDLPFHCHYCNCFFCKEHRLPENHNCDAHREYSEVRRRRFIEIVKSYVTSFMPVEESLKGESGAKVKGVPHTVFENGELKTKTKVKTVGERAPKSSNSYKSKPAIKFRFNKFRLNKSIVKFLVLGGVLFSIILLVTYFLNVNSVVRLENVRANAYKLASSSPLKLAVRIDYELVDNATAVYLQTGIERKTKELKCKSAGKCSERISLPISGFSLVDENAAEPTYVTEKQKYLLCAEFENPLILKQCKQIILEPFNFKTSAAVSIDAKNFTCPQDYREEGGLCLKIKRCEDGTEYGKCSNEKPIYCEDGNLVSKASVCGCGVDEEVEEEECVSIFLNGSEEKEFEYVLRGERGKILFTTYKGLNDYLAGQPRTYYCDPTCPSDTDIELKYLSEEHQTKELNKLVQLMREEADSKDDQARVAISLVQKIPYDWIGFETGFLSGRYPYEVLYDKAGVCGEKSKLLAYLLKSLGYGVVLFQYDEESHQAVGVKCPLEYSLNQGGYCFIETARPDIPTNYSGDYVGVGKLPAVPSETIKVSDGSSFDSIGEEYNDALEWNRIDAIAEKSGNVLLPVYYNSWNRLVYKYGIEFD
ncbi:MAG: hypothetical protein JW744_03725 [Candidatus Diapherotrites archaeon]|uniref:AN1-type domain-containing protein n=1 Tax=Candidatus Iainarchaeum sp. TaxID=3101447 RepID=A0A938YU33_9ARCH|nr:hypothetical protein [Candidatus Diapherotrites archaeon]